MAIADTAFEPLVDLYPGIAARRKADPDFDEICRDYEDLRAMAKPAGSIANHEADNLQEDLRMTIRALQEEIRDLLNKPIP